MVIQHIGVPTADMVASIKFYGDLGFNVVYSTKNGDSEVNFVRNGDVMFELYEEKEVAGRPGAVDHVAMVSEDVDADYARVKALGYPVTEMRSLNFWQGVRFFFVTGPNAEKIEFFQKL